MWSKKKSFDVRILEHFTSSDEKPALVPWKQNGVSSDLPAAFCSSSRSLLSSWSSCSGRLWRHDRQAAPLKSKICHNGLAANIVTGDETWTHVTVEINEQGFLTLLGEVAGQAVVQVLVELGAVSPLQPGAQAKVRQLDVTLQTQNTVRATEVMFKLCELTLRSRI